MPSDIVLAGSPVLVEPGGEGMSLERVGQRKSLLSQLDDGPARRATEAAGFDRFQQRAFDVLASPQLRACFDPALIDQRVQQRYGNTLFGNSAYIASKLVETGVRFVNVTWTWYNLAIPGFQDFGWDTHEHNFSIDLASSALEVGVQRNIPAVSRSEPPSPHASPSPSRPISGSVSPPANTTGWPDSTPARPSLPPPRTNPPFSPPSNPRTASPAAPSLPRPASTRSAT